jgi:hypothetical protein
MHWRNWIFLVLAAAIAMLAIEGSRRRIEVVQPQLRRQMQPDDRKPAWYNPSDAYPRAKKPSEPIGPG